MEITTFLRETYRNLPRANKPIGSRFLEPRVSQMWSIATAECRPPARNTGIAQSDHGQNLLSATGGGGATSTAIAPTGRRWSTVAQNIVSNQTTVAVPGNPSTLAVTSQPPISSTLTHQSSTVMSPTDNSTVSTTTGILGRGNSTVPTANTGNVAVGDTRRISFVIENDVESITSSQTTLAVQVFSIV